MPSTIKFDFTHYLPNISPGATIVQMPDGQCIPNNFVVAVICEDLIPGNLYRVSYQLLNPSTNPGNPINIFNPQIQDIYASFTTQKFATIADLDVQGNYVLQATLKDLTTNIQTASQISLQCGNPAQPTPTPTCTPTITPSRFSRQNNVTVSIVDPDFDPIPDNIISLDTGVNEFPLVALANNTIIGSKYSYEFFEVPSQSITFEKRTGEFYSGSSIQNFNSKIAFSGSPKFVYVYAGITDIENNITKYSEPTLIKYMGNSSECLTILPSGIDLKIDAPAFRSCNVRGLTTESISYISGGSKFSIGDKLTAVGGGGFGAELEIQSGGITADSFTVFSGGTGFTIGDYLEVTGGEGSGGLIKITSGGLSKESITSLTGSTGFKVGDLLTTTGGGGEGVVIRVTSIGPGGSILDFEILNEGYGFTFAPNGLVAITGSGVVSNVVFNNKNFSIPSAGGITADSINISGGNGYNINEILSVVGGGGFDAKIQIISGSITADSITSLGGGTGFSVGDFLTTTGGNGNGVVIRVKCVNGSGAIVNCTDGSPGWELINGGYGFTGAPTGLVSLTGSGINAAILANADNFSITPTGQITRDSISGLIGTGTGYTAGSQLIISGGGGSGAIILITSVSPSGAILSYVIVNGGSNYSTVPVVLNENGNNIVPQPTWNVSKFTDPSFVIIDQGYGYFNAPTALISITGNGVGAVGSYDVGAFTDPAFEVINSGSGYTSAPTGLKAITGNGKDFIVSFNANNFTIPPAGGLTPESVTMVGGTGYNIGDKISIQGGDGSGGVIQVVSGSLTEQSINGIIGGSGYVVGDLLTTVGGDGKGVVIRIKCVNINGSIITCLDGSAGWELVNAGYGFTGAPTGLIVLTGHGTGASLSANADNFAFTEVGGLTERALEISGGTGYNIGDKFSVSGAGGSGGLVQIVSGSLSIQSINSLLGGTGYAVGDLLTTTGGNGEGVVIRVKCVNGSGAISNCPDGSAGWELVNSGYGFTSAPTGLVALTGQGSGANITANSDNFSLTEANGITNDSLDLFGGTGYNVGDKITIGGGDSPATIQIISGGITTDTFSKLSGGTGYNIGDYISVTGGNGSDGVIQIISGSLTSSSINSLIGGTGYSVGDLLTTTGGNGEGVVIRVKCVNGSGAIANCPDGSLGWEIINGGHGFTGAPTALVALTGSGSGASLSANSDNFSITAAGGITPDSIKISGGNGYNIGEILDINGGGGTGAKIQIISGSLTSSSINSLIGGTGYAVGDLLTTSGGNGQGVVIRVKCVNGSGAIANCPDGSPGWEIINAGYGFTGAPTGLVALTGIGSGAAISANVNNFSITPTGQITSASISGLINTGTGYSVGDRIYVQGGNGSGAIIQITSVSNTGAILSYVILDGGSGYSSAPTLANASGTAIVPQPSWNVSNFTKPSFVVINQGSGYATAPNVLVSSNGDGSGAVASYNVDNFTDLAFTIVNAGYGYTSAPTGLSNITGNGSGATVEFNGNNFNLIRDGGITKDSISGLIGSSNTPPFTVGSRLYITGGGGSGATIVVTGLDGQGRILDYIVVDSGYGYDGSSPFVVKIGSINGAILSSQPVFNVTKFTKDSFVILDSGSGFENVGISISNLTGNGYGLAKTLDIDQLTKDSFVILDQGSGYLGNTPISLSTVNGSNGNGGSTFLDKDLTTQRSFIITDSGSGYTSEPTRLSNITGNGNGVSSYFDVTKFSAPAIVVTNPGSGYLDSPTSLAVVSGYGSLNNIDVQFNDNNFIEISGAAIPTPTPTPTITPTPTMSLPAPCNNLQNAGGQNDIYIISVAVPAPSGQNYLIVKDSPALQKSAILVGAGLQNDTSINNIEGFASSVSDDSGLKKIILSKTLSGPIAINAEITVYTIDIRIIKTAYWPGIMTFTYDAYSVPDRFRVIGMPVDKNKPEVLLYDSGFRGDQGALCANSYVQSLSGIGAGSVEILKPDGMIYVKVTVEAPCEGTAWQYLLSCPTRAPLISSTPTNTPTRTPTRTPTNTPTRTPNI